MLGTAIIVFREVIEAGLIVGITAAATRGIASRALWIGVGIAGGVLGACLVAAFIQTVAAAFQGNGQELFNAAILSIAVVMLAWHNIWMAHHGRELAAQVKGVGQAVAAGTTSLMALALVVGIAVLREGSEIALFLYGIAAGADAGSGTAMALGGAIGLGLGILIGVGTYIGLVRIPARYLFGVTSALLAFLAAGMAAQAVAFLQQADTIRILGATLWDSSGLLSNKSVIGRVLHTLIGYNDHPTAIEALAYAATLATIAVLTRAQATRVSKSLFGNSRVSVSADEIAAHGDEDHGVGDVDAAFIVAYEATPARHPAERALDHPAAGQDLEALRAFAASDDLDHEVEICGLVHQLEPVVGGVGEEVLHPGPALADGVQDGLGSSRVGDVGRGQVHHQQPPVRVDSTLR